MRALFLLTFFFCLSLFSIAQIPWVENFEGLANGELPEGWERGDTPNWGSFNAGNAGGQAPEMVFWWQPVSSGDFELTSVAINTKGFEELSFSFKHRIRNFGDPGTYTCAVLSEAGGQRYTIAEWVNPSDVPAENFSLLLTQEEHGVGSESFRLIFVFSGTTDNITQWDIDDVGLTLPAGEGSVSVSPSQHVYADRQIGTLSDPFIFSIENVGDSPFLLSPEMIRLEADGALSSSLSIMTYNIWFDSQNWPARRNIMLQEMRAADPDIICLQEVIQRTNLPNQAETLADSLGYFYAFSSRDAQGAPTRFGNAILSKYPIVAENNIALRPLNDFRTALHIRVEKDGNILDVYNTHLHNAAVNTHIRQEQIQDLLGFIDETKAEESLIFLCGDFNANPDWEEMNLVYEHFVDIYPVFHENHLDPEHGTLNYHLDHQQRRIDYVFFAKASVDRLGPVSAEILLDQPSSTGIYGSDHFAVLGALNILSDADEFVLQNIEAEQVLMPGETAEVGVVFAPEQVGDKIVYLRVDEATTELSGLAFDARVQSFPYEERFDGLGNGQLPQGWERSHPNWGSFNNNSAGGEAPELNFWWQPVGEGVFSVRTPLILTEGLDSMILSFKHRVVDFQDPGPFSIRVENTTPDSTYVLVEWIDPGNIAANEFSMQLNSQEHGVGAETMQISFVYEGNTGDISQWDIDDLRLHALPAYRVGPMQGLFGDQLIEVASAPITFTISNAGGDTLYVGIDDIFIEGADAEAFVLTNLTEDSALANNEEVQIAVTFVPFRVGEHVATLRIGSVSIPLSGNSIDARITEIPWLEGFDDMTAGGVPLGWISPTQNWGTFNANNAGGEAPEMVFWWQPEGMGVYPLTTPIIETADYDSLLLSFKYRIRNFGAPGTYTLSVFARANGEDRLITQWVNPDFVAASNFSTVINRDQHGLGADDFRLSWVFEGRTDNITQWDIDDISLDTIPSDPILSIEPSALDYGATEVGMTSMPQFITIRNAGGGVLELDPADWELEGADAGSFILDRPAGILSLGSSATAQIAVRFAPEDIGAKTAVVIIENQEIALSGLGIEPAPYFVYSDFTIVENGRTFTNVGGFREVAGFSSGNMIAMDVLGEGEFGNAVLELDYDLNLDMSRSVYYMWAFPPVDLSAFNRIVLIARAEEAAAEVKVNLLDSDGVAERDGGSETWIELGTDWTLIDRAVSEFDLATWATRHPDMSRIQRIDMEFVRDRTTPDKNTVQIDLVGLYYDVEVSANETSAQEISWKMLPNPAGSSVWLEIHEESMVSIFNQAGQLIKHEKVEAGLSRMDISKLIPGVYSVRVVTGKGTSSKVLVKQ